MTHEPGCRSNCPCCAVDWDCTCGATSHDPLCPGWFDTLDGQAECDACELIAKVREDTLAAAVQRVEALLDTGNTAIATAIAAIKGESP